MKGELKLVLRERERERERKIENNHHVLSIFREITTNIPSAEEVGEEEQALVII